MSARLAGREVAKRVVRRYVGMLPWFDYGLKARRAPETIRVRCREEAEVARARALVGTPSALVVTVIPTYRRPEQLRAAVRSALDQTVSDHRVVVIDDGGGLPQLEPHPRLVALSLSRNLGVAGVVRNVGIRISSSAYIAFLDDDNLWEPRHLERSLSVLCDDISLSYSGVRRVDSSGAPLDLLAVPFDRHLLRTRGYVDTSAIVVRRARRVLFSRTPRRYRDFPKEDWELVWRMSRRRKVALVPDVTVRYAVHNQSYYTDWAAEDKG